MNDTNFKYDWHKEAAAVAAGVTPEQIDAVQIERAFMNQAYNHIEHKASPLFAPEYRLGFEVVYHNDDNTRMVGVFAFKVGPELLFVPVFFVSSSIKGTNFLYRVKTKSFYPLSEDVCKTIIGQLSTPTGTLVPKQNTHPVANKMDLERIFSTSQIKSASQHAFKQMMAGLMFQDEPENNIKLAQFLKDAGVNSLQFIEHLCNKYDNVMEAMHMGYENFSEWIPNMATLPATSSVSVKLAYSACSLDEVEEFSKKGYAIEDKRDEANKVNDISVLGEYKEGVEVGEVNVCLNYELEQLPVFVTAGETSIVLDKNGCLPILLSKSLKNKVISLHDHSLDISDAPDSYAVDPFALEPGVVYSIYNKLSKTRGCLKLVSKDRSKDGVSVNYTCVIGEYYSYEADTAVNKMTQYTLCFSKHVKTTETSHFFDTPHFAHHETISFPDERGYTLLLNPKDVFVFKMKPDRPVVSVLTPEAMDTLVKSFDEESIKLAKVSENGNTGKYTVTVNGKNFLDMNEVGLVSCLIKECNLSKKCIEDVIGIVHEQKKSIFGFAKNATTLSFFNEIPETDLETTYDNEFGADVADSSTIDFVEATNMDPRKPMTLEELLESEKKVTDSGLLQGTTPLELADISNRTGIRSIFDHGVIASLAKTYDSKGLIDNYLPELEAAVDKLGRLLFLFYWKPNDFLELYGTDDQASIEGLLESNFKSFGDLVLELKKKNLNLHTGNAPLPA